MIFTTARISARIIVLAGACAPAAVRAEVAETPPPIVVTGERIERPPATQEGVDAARLDATTNIVNVEDALRYLPSLVVRKRHIGDTQAPLATRTSGVGASARSLIYADGILLSALIGNNNSNASPRWGMIAADEIARVDVLYGPFSAAYPGNAIGAVVNLTTRTPEGPEASASLGGVIQHFRQYATSGDYPALQAQASWGGRAGRFAWLVGVDHVDSEGQPLAYVTVARPAATSAAGVSVNGAFADLNRAGAPIYIVGAGGFESQVQDRFRLKLAVDLGAGARLVYRGGLFLNDTDASAQSYLTNAAGQPVYAGAVNIDGRAVTIAASAFSNNVYRFDERHWMHAVTLEAGAGPVRWRAIASLYDYDRDVQRVPGGALPAAAGGGAGTILRLDGTGWRTLDLDGRWESGAHELSFGAHHDLFRLVSDRFATADWRRGAAGARLQGARGRTQTSALWAQERWTLAPRFEATLGLRQEWWRADRGFNFSQTPALSMAQPEQRRATLSPKASLVWQFAPAWRATLSAGQAWRFPTVTELYQAVANGPNIVVPDPNLRPERARSAELAIERRWDDSHFRLSLFDEHIRDALISQTSPALISFVQNVPRVHVRGVELALDWRDLLPRFDLSGSLTLTDPEIVSDPVVPAAEGKNLPQVPRRRATLVASYRLGERATLALAGRYASRSFGTIDNSDIVAHTFQGFEGYLVLDARATWRFAEHLEAAIGVENITDDRYFLFHPFPGRTVSAEISWRW